MRKMHPVLFIAIFALMLPLACGAGGEKSSTPAKAEGPAKPYAAQDFSKLKGMKGFSDQALELHFTLYQGYVKNTNTLLEQLAQLAKEGKASSPAYAELKRRFGWEWNGMRLHELYFGNLGGKEPLKKDSPLMAKLEAAFGSYDAWQADFQATGAMRGIGWVVLYQDPESGRLVNAWINEHDLGHLTGATPLLIMDVFEHAFLPDYGLKRAEYIKAFFSNINWPAVEARLGK
jgi:Fe-Mn family superoxide dismutase